MMDKLAYQNVTRTGARRDSSVTAPADYRHPLTAKAQVRSQASPCGACSGH